MPTRLGCLCAAALGVFLPECAFAQGITRASNPLSNPVNFSQYSQVTGVKPTIGTVRIYNQFGPQQGMSGMGGGGFGGNGGYGFGGMGGGGMGGGRLPGVGTSSGGDDPPQGALLNVNYANMFLPNQFSQGGGGGNRPGGFGLGGGYGSPGNFGYGYPNNGGGFQAALRPFQP